MTGLLRALRRMHDRVRATDDRGATMIELFVAMIIMSIAGSIFVAGVVTLSRATNHAQAVTNSATSTNQAYQALDKMVRYASAISPPGVSSGTGATGDWYVELQDTTSGAEMCTQLRLNITKQQLQRRTWPASNVAAITAFVPIASGITNAVADQPFLLGRDADGNGVADEVPASVQHQELTITMLSTSGPANGRAESDSHFTLAALNSTAPPPTAAFCHQAGRP